MEVLSAFLYAFLGGIIMNLMPCVLPVLSLKLLTLSKIRQSSISAAYKGSLAYTAGVSLCMLVFSGFLIIMRGLGFVVGWGYQMQSPTFITLMIYVVFLLGLSMSGVFEFPSLNAKAQFHSKSNIEENFFTGLYCVLLATPCFAPFMGSAVSFALLHSNPLSAIIIFQGIALGLSLPYILITLSPKAIALLPKPGNWMNSMRSLMAFPMYLTAGWLLWVISKLDRSNNKNDVLYALLGVILSTFSIVLMKILAKSPTKKIYAVILTALSIAPIGNMAYSEIYHKSSKSQNHVAQKASFDVNLIQKMQKEKKLVLVEVSADWCIICKINERFLESNGMQKFMKENEITEMKADWTKMDNHITDYMKNFNAAGVPLYVLYLKNGKEIKLSQILTKKEIEQAVRTNDTATLQVK